MDNIITNLIDQYIFDYRSFRRLNKWETLEFKNEDGNIEISKQIKRYKLGVGLFNDFDIDTDYEFVSFIFNQELQLRKSEIKNQNTDVLYLYAFFLSKFKRIEDVWKFVDAKSIDFDSSIGFDTYYFMTFGVDEIYDYVNKTDNNKKELLIKFIGTKKEDILFDQEEFENWEKGKYDYYDFVKPIKRPLSFYRIFDHKELYKVEFLNWVKAVDLTNFRMAYDCICMAEYAENKEVLIRAIKYYLKHDNAVLRNQFEKKLEKLMET